MRDAVTLKSIYEQTKAEMAERVGGLGDIPRRAALLHGAFADSGGNHTFPLIAAHGALWAYSFFEVGGSLGRFIARRYFYNARERAYRLGLLQTFAEDFRRVNRQVCIDTLTNYHFAREHGHEPEAGQVVPPELLRALNHVHEARAAGRALGEDDKREVFRTSFYWEQELTVAPGVKEAVDRFQCRVMHFLCLHPVVRFAYFPRWRYLLFFNFADTSERIARGLQAYDHARRGGWTRVVETMKVYGVMPPGFFRDPAGHVQSLLQQPDSATVAARKG
jgi:hypothetical protein